jgi:dihydrofolate reductase
MGKLIMWNMVSLDGYFEGANSWDLAWHRTALCEEFDRFAISQLRSADALLLGRVTYEGFASYWSAARGEIAELMNGIRKFVFSRTLEEVHWAPTVLVKQDAAAAVAELKRSRAGGLLVFGSGELCAVLMDAGLFDEYRLAIAPVILGGGRPLFAARSNPIRLEFLDSKPLSSGGVILRYKPAQ